MDEKLRNKIKKLQLKTKYLINHSLRGNYKSAFKGQGLEFEESREYVHGDDVRRIDWKLTAKSQKPYLKVFKDERELTIYVMVDLSASLDFGSNHHTKKNIANEIASLVSYLALVSNDKIGLILFSDGIEYYIPAKKGKVHVYKILRELLEVKPKSKKTDLSLALKYFSNLSKKRSTLFIISDFLDENFEKELKLVSKKHDVTCVSIEDPSEKNIAFSGRLRIEGLEDGLVSLIKPKRETSLSKNMRDIEQICRGSNIDYIGLSTQKDYIDDFVGYLKKRIMHKK